MPSPQTERARWLRNNMTKAEWHVWSRLRDKQLDGYKFRRQVPIGPYFVDFVCLSRRLVVEIDGAGHDSKEADVKDARKTAYLESQGFEVARFGVQELDETFEDVIQSIWWRLVRPRPDADIPSESGFADPTAPPVEPWRAPPTSPASGEVKRWSLDAGGASTGQGVDGDRSQ